jgi:hypothetical protein
MRVIRIFAAFVLILGAVQAARADEAPSAEQLSLQGYAAAKPSCAEWGDGCAICMRGGDGATHCSTPGIACQPGPIVCRRESEK